MEVTSLGDMVCKNLIQALLKNKDDITVLNHLRRFNNSMDYDV
jgi:hypothetical protein